MENKDKGLRYYRPDSCYPVYYSCLGYKINHMAAAVNHCGGCCCMDFEKTEWAVGWSEYEDYHYMRW